MSISVDVRMSGDISTPEHQAAIKSIMDAIEQAAKSLPGVQPFAPYRMETKIASISRHMTSEGLLNPEPFPTPSAYAHEARMQFGFHINPVKPDAEQ